MFLLDVELSVPLLLCFSSKTKEDPLQRKKNAPNENSKCQVICSQNLGLHRRTRGPKIPENVTRSDARGASCSPFPPVGLLLCSLQMKGLGTVPELQPPGLCVICEGWGWAGLKSFAPIGRPENILDLKPFQNLDVKHTPHLSARFPPEHIKHS